MSWGVKITVLYLAFVGMILTMVFFCMGKNIELESKDYYEKELVYQDKIQAITNANLLDKSINHYVVKDAIVLKFPPDFINNAAKGEILFFRPSDAKMDQTIPMQPDVNGEQFIDKKSLVNGIYKMQLSWTMKNKKYFRESVLNIKK